MELDTFGAMVVLSYSRRGMVVVVAVERGQVRPRQPTTSSPANRRVLMTVTDSTSDRVTVCGR